MQKTTVQQSVQSQERINLIRRREELRAMLESPKPMNQAEVSDCVTEIDAINAQIQ